MKLRAHNHRGVDILPCTFQGSKRWYIPARHHTGMYYGEQDSRQFNTLEEAKAAIDYDLDTYGCER